MTMQDIFNNYKNIAVFGMSTNETKPANTVPMFFNDKGYTILPINPFAERIGNLKVSKTIIDVDGTIDILNVFRKSEACLEVVQEAVERNNKKGDIKLIWLQEGIVNEDAKKLAEENGIEFIQDKCMYKEYVAL